MRLCVERIMLLEYIPTEEHDADILTKVPSRGNLSLIEVGLG